MNYWIMKSEPKAYSWEALVKEKKTCWNGIRNYQARNNMSKMKGGDIAFFYYSGGVCQIIGLVKIIKESYPDHTADDPRWIMVDIEPIRLLKKPINLKTIKQIPELQQTSLVKQSRLSVSSLTKKEFDLILSLE